MNSFGRVFRVHIMGESHGKLVGALIDGCPAGLPLAESDFSEALERRKPGAPGTTPRREKDVPVLATGVFNGFTTGAPLLIWFENSDTRSSDYTRFLRVPRPGHADFTSMVKYGGFADYRGGGHFSGRLTTALVGAGVVARRLLPGIGFHAGLTEAGGSKDVEQAVQDAIDAGDSIGGLVECRVTGLPAGLGEPFFDSVESLLSHILFSIPAIRGVEFGTGFAAANMRGSEHNDPIIDASGKTGTNHAGGINGGITNGNELVVRLAVKPASSTPKAQETIDLQTNKKTSLQIGGRHDACIALRVPVVAESAVALVLADLMMLAGKIPAVWPEHKNTTE